MSNCCCCFYFLTVAVVAVVNVALAVAAVVTGKSIKCFKSVKVSRLSFHSLLKQNHFFNLKIVIYACFVQYSIIDIVCYF